MSKEYPLKEVYRLSWELSISDTIFCEYIKDNKDKLWLYLDNGSAMVSESETQFSMKDVKIKNLDRTKKLLYLSEHIIIENIAFDKIDLSNWCKFKNHMNKQFTIVCKHLNWDISDTGIESVDFCK
jgi:hypothetical protein